MEIAEWTASGRANSRTRDIAASSVTSSYCIFKIAPNSFNFAYTEFTFNIFAITYAGFSTIPIVNWAQRTGGCLFYRPLKHEEYLS